MYQLINNYIGDGQTILRTSDNAYIPADGKNKDYQAYQLWLEAGNTPLPAE